MEKNEKLGKETLYHGKRDAAILPMHLRWKTYFAPSSAIPKFLYSSFYSFTNEQVIDFFEELGVATKIERGNRVFPVSDHSSDVICSISKRDAAFKSKSAASLRSKKLLIKRRKLKGVRLANGKQNDCRCSRRCNRRDFISFYRIYRRRISFCRNCGHKVTELFPALVPMEVKEWYAKELQGLSLQKCRNAMITDGKKNFMMNLEKCCSRITE